MPTILSKLLLLPIALAACASGSVGPLPVSRQPRLGKTYYVSPSGSPTNPGTKAAPWLAIQQAIGSVRPGDTVVVAAGIHDAPYFPEHAIAGTAKRPIVIMADPAAAPGSVVIARRNNGSDKHTGILLRSGCDYVHIRGFTIKNIGTKDHPSGSIQGSGIFLAGTKGNELRNNVVQGINNAVGAIFVDNVSDVTIANNTITSTSGTNTRGHGLYISGSSSRVKILNNDIHDNEYIGIHINGDKSEGGSGIVTNLLIYGNIIYNNGQNGINADGIQHSMISNNVIYNNARNGVELYRVDAGEGSSYNSIVNNSIDQPNGKAVEIGDGGSVSRRNIVFNNVLHGGIGGTSTTGDELILNNNIVHSSVSPFIDSNLGNYTLVSPGPGIDKGISSFMNIPAQADASGRYHIGAFAFRHSPPNPKRQWPPTPSPAR